MDKQTINKVKNALRSFQTDIVFDSTENVSDIVFKAMEADPRIAYYIKTYSISGSGGKYRIKAEYNHRDIDGSDVIVVDSKDICEKMICRAVADYKKQLVLITKNEDVIDDALDSFYERHRVFYPNFIKLKRPGYSWGNVVWVYEFSFEYRIGHVKLEFMEQEVDAEVKRIGEMLFVPGIPNAAKIYLAHNYLATTVEYVKSRKNSLDTSYTQSAYGAFIKKRCVCQGYAEAFKRLMDYGNVECFVIHGKTKESSGGHAWNIVSLGNEGSYYHVDVTWDTGYKGPEYTYFCKNDDFLSKERSWNKEQNPVCKGSYPVLNVARNYIVHNKEKLLSNGVGAEILDC